MFMSFMKVWFPRTFLASVKVPTVTLGHQGSSIDFLSIFLKFLHCTSFQDLKWKKYCHQCHVAQSHITKWYRSYDKLFSSSGRFRWFRGIPCDWDVTRRANECSCEWLSYFLSSILLTSFRSPGKFLLQLLCQKGRVGITILSKRRVKVKAC